MKHGYLDKYSDLESNIHSLDPRLKLITALIFIICIIQTNIYEANKLPIYFAGLFFVILTSKVPIKYILKKSLLILPFIIVITFFAIFNNIEPVFRHNKMYSLVFIAIKAWLSFLVLILLSSTTKYQMILKALEKLKMPKILIMILNFMYRYIFVFIDEFERMNRARKLRSYNESLISQFKILGYIVAILYLRAYERAEKVYLSMVMRGFDGEIKAIDILSIKTKELILFILSSILLLMIYFIHI